MGRVVGMLRAVAVVGIMLGAAAPASAQVRSIGYDRFISLPERAQKAAFREADPGTKAMLKRVHAQRWLESNRRELSARQIAAVERGIAFLTPMLYEASPEDTLEQEVAMAHALECAIGRDGVRAAFTFFPPETRSFGSTIENWFSWLHACLMR